MTKKVKALIFLIVSIVVASASVVMMIVASVQASKFGKNDFTHDVTIREVVADQEKINGVLYHNAILDGKIRNNSNQDLTLVNVEIVLAGVNNATGEYAEFVTSFVLDELKADTKNDLTDEILKVGNRNGYIPESIKEIKITSNGVTTNVVYEEDNDSSLVLFSLALGLVFVAGLMLAFWNNTNKKIKQEANIEIK